MGKQKLATLQLLLIQFKDRFLKTEAAAALWLETLLQVPVLEKVTMHKIFNIAINRKADRSECFLLLTTGSYKTQQIKTFS